jgi:hypothetical protein
VGLIGSKENHSCRNTNELVCLSICLARRAATSDHLRPAVATSLATPPVGLGAIAKKMAALVITNASAYQLAYTVMIKNTSFPVLSWRQAMQMFSCIDGPFNLGFSHLRNIGPTDEIFRTILGQADVKATTITFCQEDISLALLKLAWRVLVFSSTGYGNENARHDCAQYDIFAA